MKLLIIQTAFIGDVVLATPLIEKLHHFYPDAQIDFLLRKGNEALLTGHPKLRQVFVWNKKQDKYKGLFTLAKNIRKEEYDWVINCQRFAASGLLTMFSGAKNTVGFKKNPFSFAFTKRVAHEFGTGENPVHEVSRNLNLIEHITDSSFFYPKLYPSEADFEAMKKLTLGKPYVCIAPTSVWFTKQYPAHKWEELIRKIPFSYSIFLLGGQEDIRPCETIRTNAGRQDIYNLAGKLSFLQSAALMQGARMNYANDSAPIHIASALDAPIVAVFCSTIPAFGFAPLSKQSFIVETKQQLACRPCGLHGKKACPEGHFACAESITADSFPIP
ncbi:MAG: glycosyltransferase family 9 protein [Saprospiraceae bacterium]